MEAAVQAVLLVMKTMRMKMIIAHPAHAAVVHLAVPLVVKAADGSEIPKVMRKQAV